MSAKAFVEVTAYWGADDADSTIKLRLEKWKEIKGGAKFAKKGLSYYEGQSYEVLWSFGAGKVTIDGEDGMQCVADLPVEELIVCP